MSVYNLTHKACFDGFGAAYACWRKHGENAIYIGCTFDKPFPYDQIEKPYKDVEIYMTDFSYKRDVIEKAQPQFKKFIILDHHKTAEAELKGLDDATFDMSKSGAVLSWEYFHPDTPVPAALQYVQDRDLWHFKLPNSKEINACIQSLPYDFKIWDAFVTSLDDNFDKFVNQGHAINRYMDTLTKTMCENIFYVTIAGTKVPCTNTSCHWGEVGDYLVKKFPDYPFVAFYTDRPNGTRQWSLRSSDKFDVSEVAKKLGGGGHAQAAGFIQTVEHNKSIILK